MRDNTVFFVGVGIRIDSVVDALSSICGLGTESIIVVPAVGHEWDATADYADKVMLQWHRYLSGDLRLEIEVLLGGHLLVFDEREGSVFVRLATAIQVVVAEPLVEGLIAVYEPDRAISDVRAWMPEEYGTAGPKFLLNS